ncbi:hypothetical protein ABH945_006007 [Paraburkholderia sp. GAS333]|uniref:DUF1254 domain-containing protein n=1 Tax=Paraburkholderia sp. GAS333 TaxID=3156279 RepID=UPI003D23361A
MMNMTKRRFTMAVIYLLALASGTAGAQDGKEPLGGQPAAGSRPSADLNYQILRQRAFEAVNWALPAVEIYRFRPAGAEALGLKDNDILAYSKPATPNLEVVTGNSSTPYISAFTDLRKGPVVLEIPPSGTDGSLYGQVVDAWQFTIADVGPSGLDQGKGGKYLFTPPGYTGPIPEGYIHVASPNYRITMAFRSIVQPGKTVDDAFNFSHRLRLYYLSDAANPPQQRFVDPGNQRYSTLPFFDERFFNDLADIANVEPVRPEDKVMMGMLASLGIQKGKPFNPDAETIRAMRQGAADAWFSLQSYFDHPPKEVLYWPDRHYISLLLPDEKKQFDYVYDDRVDYVGRARAFFWCIYMPKTLSDSPGTMYMVAVADKNGKLLDAKTNYKITLPAAMPAKQFWAITVYDHATWTYIYSNSERTTLSSYDMDKMKLNSDGSVTIYVGPHAPKGLESNWIPTAGRRPAPTVRFYGPTEELMNKSFRLPDFEVVGK